MSHIVQIKTEVQDAAAVNAACRRLHFPLPVRDTCKLYKGEAKADRNAQFQQGGAGFPDKGIFLLETIDVRQRNGPLFVTACTERSCWQEVNWVLVSSSTTSCWSSIAGNSSTPDHAAKDFCAGCLSAKRHHGRGFADSKFCSNAARSGCDEALGSRRGTRRLPRFAMRQSKRPEKTEHRFLSRSLSVRSGPVDELRSPPAFVTSAGRGSGKSTCEALSKRPPS